MILRKLLKIAAKSFVEQATSSAATKIGEAVGGLIGSKIYTPPDDDSDTTDDEPDKE